MLYGAIDMPVAIDVGEFVGCRKETEIVRVKNKIKTVFQSQHILHL